MLTLIGMLFPLVSLLSLHDRFDWLGMLLRGVVYETGRRSLPSFLLINIVAPETVLLSADVEIEFDRLAGHFFFGSDWVIIKFHEVGQMLDDNLTIVADLNKRGGT